MPRRSAPDVSRRRSQGCTHHWVIEMPAGATSRGRCRRCGRVRRFRNAAEEWPSKFLRRSKPRQ
jgi:hypothetical protein